MFLLFTSCSNDYGLHYKVITYEVIEEVNEIIVIEDTSPDYQNIWVDSFNQPTTVNGVDIIWVIDPSGSMNSYQPVLLGGIASMMAALPQQGWRLTIIPADRRKSKDQQIFPLLPGDTVAMAETMYHQANEGTFEAGFDSLYEYIMNNSYSSTWMRQDAALLTVFVSDEDEQSQEYFNTTYNFNIWYNQIRQHSYIASIVNLPQGESICPGNQNPLNVGNEYIAAANFFNGSVVDICSPDWSAGVLDASNQIAPYEYYDLSNNPLDSNYIYVFIDRQPNYDWTYNSQENRIYFTILPPGNTLVEIAYYVQ